MEDYRLSNTPQKDMPNVEECIKYIESCGWKLIMRGKVRFNPNFKPSKMTGAPLYYFRNESANIWHKDFYFSLHELREAYRNGW